MQSYSKNYYTVIRIMCGIILSILLQCDAYHVWIHIQYTITMCFVSCVHSYSVYYYNVMPIMCGIIFNNVIYRFIFNILLQCDDFHVWNHNQYTITMWWVSCVDSYLIYYYNLMNIMCGIIFNILIKWDDYYVWNHIQHTITMWW